MIGALIPVLSTIATNVSSSLFPSASDKNKKVELEQAVERELIKQSATIEKMAGDIIKEEARAGFLASSWRPITMLVFVTLITAHWLGFTPEGISEEEVIGLLEIVKVGLGGYVLGRSGEKIVKTWKSSR